MTRYSGLPRVPPSNEAPHSDTPAPTTLTPQVQIFSNYVKWNNNGSKIGVLISTSQKESTECPLPASRGRAGGSELKSNRILFFYCEGILTPIFLLNFFQNSPSCRTQTRVSEPLDSASVLTLPPPGHVPWFREQYLAQSLKHVSYNFTDS